ncbi:hypothetical protein OAD81_03945 [Flavobacteriaceae bacterium]|nr:hypothetical protein [Flavobacteriaceae bacterium]|tara:strand:+ start:480 stop:1502 length:1023 start_codon:yes stop_codon:yes gene_type:complete
MDIKVCSNCGEEKSLELYPKGINTCKKCKNQYFNSWKKAKRKNPDYAERERKYNRELLRKKAALKNKDKIEARQREKETGLRVCNTCNKEKPFSEFGKQNNKSKVTGETLYLKRCIKCTSIRIQEWREKNHEERFAYRKKYREENIENIKNKREALYNSEQGKKYRDEYLKENKERISEQRQEHRKQNKKLLNDRWREWKNEKGGRKKINERRKERKKTDPLFKLKTAMRSRLYIAIKRGNYTKRSKTYEYLGGDYTTATKHLESQFTEGMSWENHGEWDIDHIIPLASAKNEYELIALFYYKNTQPLWSDINEEKQAKYEPKDKEKYLEWYSKNVKPLE